MDKKQIYLAGGCFWGVEEFFSRIDGVLSTEVGYADGKSKKTNYNDIKNTDHSETVLVEYDNDIISLDNLLDYYFLIIDPTSKNRQGNDTGRQYRTAIYFTDKSDVPIIDERIKTEQKKYNLPIVTEIKPLANYCSAEGYHQDYLKKNPMGYCHIDMGLLKR